MFVSGSHSHVEQPSSSMSWQEPCIQQFISESFCTCVITAACKYGRDWYKSWLFACTSRCIAPLPCKCDHPPNSHQQIACKKAPEGAYMSRLTAEYPPDLCDKSAAIFHTFVSKSSRDLTLQDDSSILPIKSHSSPPFPRHDGGGFVSTGDWSAPNPGVPDCLQTLRRNWMQKIISQKMDKKLIGHFQYKNEHAPFSDEELQPFKSFLEEFSVSPWSYPKLVYSTRSAYGVTCPCSPKVKYP